METILQYFIRIICLREYFPVFVDHFIDLSFLILNISNYLIYFMSDGNFKSIFYFKKAKN